MGSIVPFQDLNLLPELASSSMAAASSSKPPTTYINPKIEPKFEPFDEGFAAKHPPPARVLQEHQEPQRAFLPSSTANNDPNSILMPMGEESATPLAQAPGFSAEDSNVYEEFYRISELFRSAFAKRFPQHQDDSGTVPDSRAIVPFPAEIQVEPPPENQVSTMVVARKRSQRSAEMVRLSNLSDEDERYFRSVVRQTRMVFDGLRVLSAFEEDKKIGKRLRGDLKASAIMKERGMWLNRDKRIVGSIPGVYVGDLFFFRMELCVVGLHGHIQAGIDYVPASQSSNGEPIATSIIVSGGYEDDEDAGDVIIYTGQGGQDKLNRQCAHQKLEYGNFALERSMHYGIEVRVIRGIKYPGSLAQKVYVYDGLYRIVDCWFDVGRSGFGVYKYKLERIVGQPEMGISTLKFAQTLKTRPLLVRPAGYLSLDISQRKENFPVFLFNDIDSDQEPLYYEYLASTVFPPFAFHLSGNGTGCGCPSICGEGCFCALKNGGEFAYDNNGVLLRGKPLVFECGPFCNCPPQCRNRVTQRGLKNRLEIFRSRETGWGVRSLDVIQAGSFICEYAGVVLTKEQAQVVSMNGDNLVHPDRFTDRWAEWGDLSQIYPDYARPSYPPMQPLDIALDVSRMRNVACYISQSSTPNVFVQFVLYDHNNLMFPHLMLFALENIPPLRELSLDYGVNEDYATPKLSICN
ncbi:hypothetical protein UlMin_010151 [Ulmus minor]